MASTKAFYAVVAGVGAGTGRSVALRFAKAYPVVLIARNPSNYTDIVAEIKQQGGEARGISADTSDPAAVASAFETIKAEFEKGKGLKLAAAIYNVGAGFAIKPFLEVQASDLDASLNSNARGLFNFAQATLPSLLDAVPTSPHPPTLLITGATASVRGSARFATFAAGKFAVRALGQSLAREFGPQGVHVAHVIVDGVIDIPRTRGYTVNDGKEDGKISPDAVSSGPDLFEMFRRTLPADDDDAGGGGNGDRRLPRVIGTCIRSIGRASRRSWISNILVVGRFRSFEGVHKDTFA